MADVLSTHPIRLMPARVADDEYAEGRPRFDDGLPNMYGGRVLAHAVWSGLLCTDIDQFAPHSVHAHFVGAARPDLELEARVERVRDGRAFVLRSVSVTQAGRLVMLASISSHLDEPGDSWPGAGDSTVAPPQHGPLSLATPLTGFDVRAPAGVSELGWPRHPVWLRWGTPLPADPRLHAALLGYVSDAGLVWASRGAGTAELPSYRLASLDHALWIHRPPRMDQWLRFDATPVVNEGARGLTRASFTDERGQLVATVMQESLIRPPTSQRQR